MKLHFNIQTQMDHVIQEWMENGFLATDDLFVIGCSTSEVAGKRIGTSGSEEVASIIYDTLDELSDNTGIHLAFQCCEHLNRALVIEREAMRKYDLEEVHVIPTPEAGGSMASFAYKQMTDAVVIEEIRAHAGMDIGETMIGMHLRSVAVPLRLQQNYIGHARLLGGRTRPKLIGGARAHYES